MRVARSRSSPTRRGRGPTTTATSASARSTRHCDRWRRRMSLEGKSGSDHRREPRHRRRGRARRSSAAGVKLGLASRSGDDLGLADVVARPVRRARPRGARRARVAATVERFGGIDIVVANAGVGAYGPFLELSHEHLDEMIDVEPEGHALRGARGAAAPAAAATRRTSSRSPPRPGRRGLPYEAVYCASKFGQVGFTRALDHELREHGIRCTNVCPGGVATDFALDDGRGRTPEVAAGDDDRRGRRRGRRLRARRGRATSASSRPRSGR